jgi:hypothetical protein
VHDEGRRKREFSLHMHACVRVCVRACVRACVELLHQVCDASSVPDGDILERESPENGSRIFNAHHNPCHRWSYLPRMGSDEAVVFKTYESQRIPGRSHFALHCAFDEGAARGRRSGGAGRGSGAAVVVAPGAAVRESIEIRVACFVMPRSAGTQALAERVGVGSAGAPSPVEPQGSRL